MRRRRAPDLPVHDAAFFVDGRAGTDCGRSRGFQGIRSRRQRDLRPWPSSHRQSRPDGTADPKIRALNQEEPVDGERQEVYCTKVGTVRPDEMYIVSGHMDGHGVNQASNDDASGTALVMELARIFSAPGVRTDRSIRFVLWNNEETGRSEERRVG